MTAVYLLRHPQTTWNVARRYQGRLESPVSEEGRRQARAAAAAFQPGDLGVVYSSPLGRALVLAHELASASGAPLVVDQRLTEMGQGRWEGLGATEIQSRYPRQYQTWYEAPATLRWSCFEELSEVQRRALSLLADVYDRHIGGQVAVVTHSVVIQSMVAASLDLPLDSIHRLHISNGGITTLCGTGAPGTLLSLNTIAPLYQSLVAAGEAEGCAEWRPVRKAS